MSQYCKLIYNSPFVGLFIFAPDYIKILQNLKNYIESPLLFIPTANSRYVSELPVGSSYPIGILTCPLTTESVEIHFLHYHTESEVRLVWERRTKRIDYDNMIIKFCDRDLCTPELIKAFDELPFPSKVCFTAAPYPYKSVIVMDNFQKKGTKYVDSEWLYSHKYYNFVEEANKLLENKRK